MISLRIIIFILLVSLNASVETEVKPDQETPEVIKATESSDTPQSSEIPEQTESFETPEAQFDPNFDMNMTEAEIKAQQQYIEQQRNIVFSCIYVTRNYLNIEQGVVNQLKVIAGAYKNMTNNDQRIKLELKVWRRIYTDGVKHCVNKQTYERAMQIYNELHAQQLNITQYYDLLDQLDLESYENKKAKITFDEEEETIWKLIDGYEKTMKQKYGDKDDDDDEATIKYNDTPDYSQYEPKLFGVSMKWDSSIQILVLFFAFGLFALILFMVYRVLSKVDELSPQKKKPKKNKNKKKNEE